MGSFEAYLQTAIVEMAKSEQNITEFLLVYMKMLVTVAERSKV
jgi:hypothetical protein